MHTAHLPLPSVLAPDLVLTASHDPLTDDLLLSLAGADPGPGVSTFIPRADGAWLAELLERGQPARFPNDRGGGLEITTRHFVLWGEIVLVTLTGDGRRTTFSLMPAQQARAAAMVRGLLAEVTARPAEVSPGVRNSYARSLARREAFATLPPGFRQVASPRRTYGELFRKEFHPVDVWWLRLVFGRHGNRPADPVGRSLTPSRYGEAWPSAGRSR